ncbi:hypothetical protein PFISCL1PPCAC_16674, partial [Pristionchus fissidentatus]
VTDKEYFIAKMEWRQESKTANERIENWLAMKAGDENFVKPFVTGSKFGATLLYSGTALPTIERHVGASEKDERDE